MQGLWQRKKVNLNATPTAPSPNAAPTPPPARTSAPPLEEPPHPDSVPPASGNAEEQPQTATSSGKRKLRSTRGEEGSKRSRVGVSNGTKEHAPPTVRLSDLGGVDPCVEKMLELVAMPLTHPEVYLHTGVQPPRGVLLYGPPGCGKTMLANAIGGVRFCSSGFMWSMDQWILVVNQELGVPFISVSAPSIVSGMSGESEKTLRETFEEAKVRTFRPCEESRHPNTWSQRSVV